MQFLLTLLAGAGLMYLFDPRAGRRRRALLRDKLEKLQNTLANQAEGLAKDAGNRGQGAAAETMRRVMPEEPVDDAMLTQRIRSEMGHYVSNPHAIDVSVEQGVVTLSGNILASEAQSFVAQVKAMKHVEKVENHLDVHQSADNIPDLQG